MYVNLETLLTVHTLIETYLILYTVRINNEVEWQLYPDDSFLQCLKCG